MTNLDRIAELVESQDFARLFISELGWDNPKDLRPVCGAGDAESGPVLCATPVASKRGVVVYHSAGFGDRSKLAALDREIEKRSIERLVIVTGTGTETGEQQWRWPERRKSGGTRYVTHNHRIGASNHALFQRLNAVRFDLAEEAELTVMTVRQRVRTQFNADKVTKRFFDEFQTAQRDLKDKIEGIGAEKERSWYSSLLLNRFMFIYFMQRKGFLNDDLNYLRTSLRRVGELEGPDRFYGYYRGFLLPLFHVGLGSGDHHYNDERTAAIIGDVPYINGGIFSLHSLESDYDIRVADEAFEKIFDFFDRYRWHLDERPTGNPEEINPEILGHIFEKYVNQKEQGAYYTKEDVTGYMTSMALLPVVLEKIADAVGRPPWALLRLAPSRYLPEGLTYGCDELLPADVASADDAEVGILDQIADPKVGLPGERWRETLSRRDHAEDLRKRLGAGTVSSFSQLLTENLNLAPLALDWIAELGDEGHAGRVWEVLNNLKIVDPTCGSGAFLLAAFDIVEELYDAALTAAEKAVTNKTADGSTRAIVADASGHGSRRYFVGKRVVLYNLYGVDLMPEATEIARLRLFLALVARLDDRSNIEPLPDLDMNIRAGNLLVGCSTAADARSRFESNFLALDRLPAIEAQSAETAKIYRNFVEAQREENFDELVGAFKNDFLTKTAVLRDELDLLYSPQDRPGPDHETWRDSHRPFHWFVEFPEVMGRGGGVRCGHRQSALHCQEEGNRVPL